MRVGADTDSVIPGVFKRGPNNYGFRANIPGGGGKQVRRSGYPTQDAAYKARIAYLGGELAPGSHETVRAYIARWLVVVKETRRPTTACEYREALDYILPDIGDIALRDLHEDHIREALRRMVAAGYATETIRRPHRRLKTALYDALREERVTRNVARNVVCPKGKPPKKMQTWSFEQLMCFATYTATQRDAAMWATWISTGLRRGEICGLKWPKVYFDRSELGIDWNRTLTGDYEIVEGEVKTEAGERAVPLAPPVLSLLRKWRLEQPPSEYVFTTAKGLPYSPNSLNQRLDFLAKKAGLPHISPHGLRHTFASRALDNKTDIKVLSALLGHSKIEITQNLYQHVSSETAHAEIGRLAERMFTRHA